MKAYPSFIDTCLPYMSLHVAKLIDKTRPRWLGRSGAIGNMNILIEILTGMA